MQNDHNHWTLASLYVVTDYENQFGDKLKSCHIDGIAAVQYNYDGLGKRRNKLVGTGTAVTWYRYDLGWNMVAEYSDPDSDWDIENRTGGYVYTPGGQVGMVLARSVGADLDYTLVVFLKVATLVIGGYWA